MTVWNEHEDAISDAIDHSIDMDWTSRTGAKAVVAWLNDNAPAAPQAAGMGDYTMALAEPQAFEKFPLLAAHIERMAAGHGVGSLIEWDAFLRDLNAALRAPSREPEGGAVDEPLKWFLKVIEGAGGEVCSTESRHNPINVFCEDRDNGDDTFNISEAAGYTQTSHDTSFDTSTTRITDKGRTYLAALRAQPPAREARHTMTLSLSDAEMTALEELIAKKDLDGPKIFRDSFKLYQAVEHGAASVTWTESGPLGLPATYPPQAREDAQPVGWLRAADEEMVCAHLGVAEAGDSYETAKKKLASLIQWNIAVAMDLSVGGRPAPDALRVAVEALEPFAYFAKHGTSREYINSDAPDDGLCAAASFPAGAYRGAVQALAALQAEQGAK